MSKIAVLLTNGFADWEYALIAGTGGPYFRLNVQFFTPVTGDVRSMGGLTAHVTQGLEDLAKWQPDAVVVVGGGIWDSDDAPDISGVLTTQHAKGAAVAGICGGTLALARAGLLENVRHTSNDLAFLSQNAASYGGTDQYVGSAAAISDNRIITAPGTAPVSFAAAIFESVGLDGGSVADLKTMLAAEHA